jgi:peptidoglycan/xylan/chitin deacetylase (PgdA/CDA1 family)
VRELIKNVIAATLYHSGVLRLLLARSMRRRGVVLMYHRVLPQEVLHDSYSAASIVVTPPTFEAHLQALNRYLQPVGPQEFFERLTDRKQSLSGHCLITFDDGWYDNHDHALPLLERHRVPALIYVATDYVGSDKTFWQERLARMLHMLWRARAGVADLYRDIGVADLLAQSEAQVRGYIRTSITALKSQSKESIDVLVSRAADALRAQGLIAGELGQDRFMTWEQVERLQWGGVVTVGSHAQSHTPIPKLDAVTAAAELRRSNERIAQQIGAVTPWFAFPNGDHDQTTRDLVRAAGYAMAVTTDAGFVASGDDPMSVRRLGIHEKAAPSPARLLCKIAGLF